MNYVQLKECLCRPTCW